MSITVVVPARRQHAVPQRGVPVSGQAGHVRVRVNLARHNPQAGYVDDVVRLCGIELRLNPFYLAVLDPNVGAAFEPVTWVQHRASQE